MAAAWGGFIFVLNLIAVHAVVLFFLGRYNSKVHTAYTLFFIIGTFGATRVPVIGWSPLKSFEQIGALAVFISYQILEYCEVGCLYGATCYVYFENIFVLCNALTNIYAKKNLADIKIEQMSFAQNNANEH